MANIRAVDVQDPAVRQSAVRVGSSTSQLNALMTKGRSTYDDFIWLYDGILMILKLDNCNFFRFIESCGLSHMSIYGLSHDIL